MKRILLFVMFGSLCSFAQEFKKPLRPVHTFSIVARDPATGEIGVAVQSHWFNVGSIVPWAEAGVGAVATQSFVDPSYGAKGLELMRKGTSAPDALLELLKADKSRKVRQVAMVDAQGRAAGFTGAHCIQAAGDMIGKPPSNKVLFRSVPDAPNDGTVHVGENYSVQANLMTNESVWPMMDKAFNETKGDLATRILAALDAAQAAGGDIRGKQSAALIIVKAKSSGKPWEDRIFDLRVDDSPDPLKELRRLVTLQRAYNHMNAGDLAVEHKDNAAALREYAEAEKLIDGVPGIEKSRLAEMTYWHAVALVNMGKVEESLPVFKRAFKIEPSWRETTKRLPRAELLPNDPLLIERIVGLGK
jgi:uncharacterized Ntn-hydrolase superfamily protein